jgi:hypothetical protein
MGRRRKRIDAKRLVKISRDNIRVGRKSPGHPKRRWSNWLKQVEPSKTRRRRKIQQSLMIRHEECPFSLNNLDDPCPPSYYLWT